MSTAVDYVVLDDMVERVGANEFRRMADEVAPVKFDWKQTAVAFGFALTLVFWMGATPNFLEIDELHPVSLYAAGVTNALLVARRWLV